jgi:hypothetical protein
MNISEGETFESYVPKMVKDWNLVAPKLDVGEYHPRIWRTGQFVEERGEAMPRVEDTPFRASFVNSLQQIEGLFDDLLSIFRVVHPATNVSVRSRDALRGRVGLGLSHQRGGPTRAEGPSPP